MKLTKAEEQAINGALAAFAETSVYRGYPATVQEMTRMRERMESMIKESRKNSKPSKPK